MHIETFSTKNCVLWKKMWLSGDKGDYIDMCMVKNTIKSNRYGCLLLSEVDNIQKPCLSLRLFTDETRCSWWHFVIDNIFSSTRNSMLLLAELEVHARKYFIICSDTEGVEAELSEVLVPWMSEEIFLVRTEISINKSFIELIRSKNLFCISISVE